MADIVHTAMKLLLFSIIATCLNGDGLILAQRVYDISYPCQQDEVCFQIWQFSTSETHDYIATVSNGEIQKASTSEDVKCKLKIRNPTAEDVGRLNCRRRPTFFSHFNITFPGKMRFRCRATVGEQVQTSEELYVRVPGPKRGGRGFIIEAETEKQGGNQDTVGLTVGVVGCAVLSALVAVFVVKKRRTSRQLPKESCNMTTSNNDVNADDVVYAEILLPVASGRVLIQDSEPTEYAYVQNK
uniref:uncharacterized protein isoform X2 n=1 Tax=Semicossyphus pulcher TaxID=241346 RepID=UPI0037E8D680